MVLNFVLFTIILVAGMRHRFGLLKPKWGIGVIRNDLEKAKDLDFWEDQYMDGSWSLSAQFPRPPVPVFLSPSF